ncbi:MAG: hypothetical protein MPN21_27815, partial [Thermoanaerobaculia bacterium]|nr:hypothetical protein [Thermoanaerobaculia bacterium]
MSNPLSKNFKRRRLLTLALLTLGLAAASVAGALPFETVYGAMGQVDRANRGVTPVTGCQGGGSIAVGTRGSFPNSLVYVARTDDWGNRLWERLYDIRPVNGDGRYGDTGESIVEVHDGTGFVIAGQTRDAEASLDAFLLKVDCEGLLSWVRIYHSPFDEGALDLVEATTGDPDFGTRRGDLIVAGFGIFPGTNLRNALLFRTSSTGTLIWGRRYTIFDEVRSAFRSVIETSPSGGTTTGDIVAAGRIVMGGPEQGYVVRVSGNTGTEAG